MTSNRSSSFALLFAPFTLLAACMGGGTDVTPPAPPGGPGGGNPATPTYARLWVPNYNAGTVSAWNRARLSADLDGAPDVTITLPANARPNAVVFDATNAMWVNDYFNSRLYKFGRNQLGQSGTPVPQVTIDSDGQSLGGAVGMCFDSRDNLWVAKSQGLEMYQPDNLDQSGPTTPNRTLTAQNFEMPADIQFDAAGNLWVSSASQTNSLNTICVFNPSQVATGGLQAPHLRMECPLFTLVEGLRFDSRGDLWVSCNNSSRVLRFTAASVAVPAAASLNPRSLTPVGYLEADGNDTAAGRTVRKPGGIVFDNVGNLFINSERESAADISGVLHFSAQQVTGITGPQTVQARVLIARSTSNPGFGGLALERP